MAKHELKLVVVTPERKVLDEPVASLRFPLYDGEIGILPGRAPLIGRLGKGKLTVRALGTDAVTVYAVSGGFAQVKGSVVTLLTDSCSPAV